MNETEYVNKGEYWFNDCNEVQKYKTRQIGDTFNKE